jgi:hypothetical protein
MRATGLRRRYADRAQFRGEPVQAGAGLSQTSREVVIVVIGERPGVDLWR